MKLAATPFVKDEGKYREETFKRREVSNIGPACSVADYGLKSLFIGALCPAVGRALYGFLLGTGLLVGIKKLITLLEQYAAVMVCSFQCEKIYCTRYVYT